MYFLFTGREAVLCVRNGERVTSQGTDSSGKRERVTYVVVIAVVELWETGRGGL
jgi:hypothetical protein